MWGEKRVSLTVSEAKIAAWVLQCDIVEERSLAIKFEDLDGGIIDKTVQRLFYLDMVEPL